MWASLLLNAWDVGGLGTQPHVTQPHVTQPHVTQPHVL